MNLDTESATYPRMKGQSRSCHTYLLLQVWCSLLTVAMVAVAAVLFSMKVPSREAGVSPGKPQNLTDTVPPFSEALRSPGTFLSFIQLYTHPEREESNIYRSSFLSGQKTNIQINKTSFYFLYAQVTFRKSTNQTRKVILQRNKRDGKQMKLLVEGVYSNTLLGSLWVAKIVKLKEEDNVSIRIEDDFLKDETYWGAIELP